VAKIGIWRWTKTIKRAFLVDYCSSMIDLRGTWNAEIMDDLPQPILVSIVLRKKVSYHILPLWGLCGVNHCHHQMGVCGFSGCSGCNRTARGKNMLFDGKVHGWREREGGRHIWRSFSQIRVFCVFLC
jgi:hypothetical protein